MSKIDRPAGQISSRILGAVPIPGRVDERSDPMSVDISQGLHSEYAFYRRPSARL